MGIKTDVLRGEKELIVREYEALKKSFEDVTKNLETMKNNLNALHGAIQWSNKLIRIAEESDQTVVTPLTKPKAKIKMKNFKNFVKEENLKDFDEDCLASKDGKYKEKESKIKEEKEEKNENI